MTETGKARTWVLAWIGAAVAGLGLLAGVGCALDANACPFRKSKPITTTDGEALFSSLCIGCHGRSGEGGRGPTLRSGAAATYDLEMLIEKVRRGKPLAGMPAFGKAAVGGQALTAEQIRAVALYLMSLRATPAPSPS